MARTRGSPPTTVEDDDENLSVGLHSRVSEGTWAALQKRAKEEGIKPSTWVRVTVRRALGLLGKRTE